MNKWKNYLYFNNMLFPAIYFFSGQKEKKKKKIVLTCGRFEIDLGSWLARVTLQLFHVNPRLEAKLSGCK